MRRREPPPAHTPDPAKARSPPPPPPLPGVILDLADSLLRRLQDLEDYQIPQLAQCRGPASFHEELAAGVRGELAGCKRDIEELKLEVDDLDKARERAAGGEHVKQVQQRLEGCTKLYRQAVVTSKRQIDASAHLLAREELFASVSGRGSPGPAGPGGNGAGPNQTADDALMSATSDVTEGLRRTLQLMQQEVDRSLVTNEMLQSQTQTMELTSNQYSTLSTLLHTSKTLITSLERADVLDRLLLFFAFAFFAGVCAYIFKKRVVDRGVRVVGGLGGLVAKGGGALAGLTKRQGAGGADISSPGKAAEAAKQMVRNEVMGEVARATAAAGAAVSAVWAGVGKVRERAFKPSPDMEDAHQDEPEVLEDVAPREEEEERVAEPVQAQPLPSSVDLDAQTDETTDADDEFFDFAPDEPFDMPTPVDSPFSLFDESDSPVHAAPLESFSDEALVSSSAPPLPAESTTIEVPSTPTPEPAAQLPLDDVPGPSEGRGLFERGDADAHRAPIEPAQGATPTPASNAEEVEDEVEPVLLRQEHPPQPSIDRVEDVFDRRVDGEAPTDAVEEEEEEEQGIESGDQASAVGEEDRVFDRSQYEPFRPTRPDLDKQLGDINRIIEENAMPPASSSDEGVAGASVSASPSSLDIPESTTIHVPSSVPDLDTGVDLPIDYSDIDESTASLHPVRVPFHGSAPSDADHVAIVHDAEEAEEARDVAGVEGTTVPLDADEVRADSVPPLDVEESGQVPLETGGGEAVEREMELPVDFAAEQTLWDADESSERQTEEASAPSESEAYVEEEQASEEELLEQMMEQQMGYGGGVGAIAAANASRPLKDAVAEPSAPEPAADEEEPAATQDDGEEEGDHYEAELEATEGAFGSAHSEDGEQGDEDSLGASDATGEPASSAEEPTASKTVEPTSFPHDEVSAAPEPPTPTSTFEAEEYSAEDEVDDGADEQSAAPAEPPSEPEPAHTVTPTGDLDEPSEGDSTYDGDERSPDAEEAEAEEAEAEVAEAEETDEVVLELDGNIRDHAFSGDAEEAEEVAELPEPPTSTPFPPSESNIVEEMITPSPSTVEHAASTIELVTPTPTAVPADPAAVPAHVEPDSPVETASPVDASSSDQADLGDSAETTEPFVSDAAQDDAREEEHIEADDGLQEDEPLTDDDSAEAFEGAAGDEEDGIFDESEAEDETQAPEALHDEL